MPWRLYYISLMPLFGYILIKYFEPCSLYLLWHGHFGCLRCEQWAFIIVIVAIIFASLLIVQLAFKSHGSYEISGAKISAQPKSLNHEMIGILASVVLPFLTVNFTSVKECAASLFIIVIIGIIATRSNVYYKNPVLALMNFKIYKISFTHLKDTYIEVDVISLNTLSAGDGLYLKKIGEDIYYAKKS